MKRALVYVLILVLTTLLFTACANESEVSDSTGIPSMTPSEAPSPTSTVTMTPNGNTMKNTLFTSDLSREDKQKAVDTIYTTVKKVFASWNTFTLEDWNAAYPEALERVLATDNTYDFYKELMRFTALLNDNHTYVSFPNSAYNALYFTPLWFEYLSDGYYVMRGRTDVLQNLPQYSKIKKIDGIPIETYLEEKVFPYIWHAKVNTAVAQSGSFMACIGQAGTQSFEVLTPEGKTVTAAIERIPFFEQGNGSWTYPMLDIHAKFDMLYTSSTLDIYTIDSDYAYVCIKTFTDYTVVQQFEAHLEELKKARGIILDVRGNNGGIANYAAQIAKHFITDTYPDLSAEQSIYDSDKDSYTLHKVNASSLPKLGDITVPVVVLQDYTTCSAAEHFLDFMSHVPNARSMGTESAGGTGDTMTVSLPGGGTLHLAKYKIARSDGTPFLNIGIQPDIYVENTIEDYLNCHDAILDAGLQELKRMVN